MAIMKCIRCNGTDKRRLELSDCKRCRGKGYHQTNVTEYFQCHGTGKPSGLSFSDWSGCHRKGYIG